MKFSLDHNVEFCHFFTKMYICTEKKSLSNIYLHFTDFKKKDYSQYYCDVTSFHFCSVEGQDMQMASSWIKLEVSYD